MIATMITVVSKDFYSEYARAKDASTPHHPPVRSTPLCPRHPAGAAAARRGCNCGCCFDHVHSSQQLQVLRLCSRECLNNREERCWLRGCWLLLKKYGERVSIVWRFCDRL